MVVLFLLMSFSRMVSMVLVLSHTLISHMLLALSTKRMSFTSRKWRRGVNSRYHLIVLCLVWIKRIRRQGKFKIPLCNPSGGNLFLRQSRIQNPVKHQRRSSFVKTANGLNTLTVSTKKHHHRLSIEFKMRIRLGGVGGLQVHAIRSRRLVYKEVVEALSNYKKSNFWWFGNPACGYSTGSSQIEKD